MRDVLHFILIVTFNVGMYVSQNIPGNFVENSETVMFTTDGTPVLTTAKDPKLVLTERVCYTGLSICYDYHRGKQLNEVCAHHKDFGLVDFENKCTLIVQNCLFHAEIAAKKANVPDSFFYNGANKPCEYYLGEGNTLQDAVNLYYLEGLMIHLSRDKKDECY